jgi:hypothetical protein
VGDLPVGVIAATIEATLWRRCSILFSSSPVAWPPERCPLLDAMCSTIRLNAAAEVHQTRDRETRPPRTRRQTSPFGISTSLASNLRLKAMACAQRSWSTYSCARIATRHPRTWTRPAGATRGFTNSTASKPTASSSSPANRRCGQSGESHEATESTPALCAFLPARPLATSTSENASRPQPVANRTCYRPARGERR